jgi:predicted house-cleaning noncanonical NTP pyrophosphatase (MazG superfamily)
VTDRVSLIASLPEKVIRDCYVEFASRRVTGRERLTMLVAKIHEEVAEAVEAFEADDVVSFVEELADTVEVCYALGGYETVESARKAKLAVRGGFEQGLVMRLADRTDK